MMASDDFAAKKITIYDNFVLNAKNMYDVGKVRGRMLSRSQVYLKFKESLILIPMVQTLHTAANILHV